jgi:hypothetical protein
MSKLRVRILQFLTKIFKVLRMIMKTKRILNNKLRKYLVLKGSKVVIKLIKKLKARIKN